MIAEIIIVLIVLAAVANMPAGPPDDWKYKELD